MSDNAKKEARKAARQKKKDLKARKFTLVQRDGLNVLVETNESKARTEKRRFVITTAIAAVSALAAIAAAVLSLVAIYH